LQMCAASPNAALSQSRRRGPAKLRPPGQ
jgi:hypothetical protein